MNLKTACQRNFGASLIFEWQQRFPATVNRLRSAGLLYDTADRIAEQYIQALVDIAPTGPVSQLVLDSLLDKALTTEPPVPDLRPTRIPE
jgi:hypothetical protein